MTQRKGVEVIADKSLLNLTVTQTLMTILTLIILALAISFSFYRMFKDFMDGVDK